MTATISYELQEIEDGWEVSMNLVGDEDHRFDKHEVFRFETEEEAREGLERALLAAEKLKKEGTVTSIEVRGEVSSVNPESLGT